jgi:FtsP/CotA-like multicopper oxidase with cupredoxin domain
MSKKRKKTGKESSGVSRRDMLKIGGAAGAATVLGPSIFTSRKAAAAQGVPEPIICDAEPDQSPEHTPFRDSLPIPLPALPVILNPAPTKAANENGGEFNRAAHQRWEEFLPDVQYFMDARAATHRFHSDFLPSYFWGFNGRYPAPTPLNFYGHPTLVRFRNSLPAQGSHNNGGRSEITIHLHNGHTASESDGFAGDFFPTGFFKDNHYANAYAGIDSFMDSDGDGVKGDPREAMHTFWFHDHRARWTAPNNYLGLNGMYLVYDRFDTPLDFLAPSSSLRLPSFYGITDIPLILTDKLFCATDPGRGRTEMFQDRENPEIGASPNGDKWVVNGKIQPKLSVRRRKYRFRILNTGPSKLWQLMLVDANGNQKQWTVVAVDANFLRTPWQPVGNLEVHVASRYDIIIDFAQFPVGTSVYLREQAQQFVRVGATPISANLPVENVVMRFDVVGNTIIPDVPAIKNPLVELPTMPVPSKFFEWKFQRPLDTATPAPLDCRGQNQINGLVFDENRADRVVMKGSTEEWTLTNNICTNNWSHPVHIHFEEGRIISRTFRPDPVNQPNNRVNVNLQQIPGPLNPDEDGNNSRRDVYPLPGQHQVKLRIRFRDFVGRYLIHCHNMGHEDDFMMVRFDIVDSFAELRRKTQEIAERRRAAGVSVEDGMPTDYRKDSA